MDPSFHLHGIRYTLYGDLEAAKERVGMANLIMYQTKMVNVNNLEIIKNQKKFADGSVIQVMSQYGFDSAKIYVPPRPKPVKPKKAGRWVQYIWPAIDAFNSPTLFTNPLEASEWVDKFKGIVLCKGGGFESIYDYIPKERFYYDMLPDFQYWPTYLPGREDLFRPYEYEEDEDHDELTCYAFTTTEVPGVAQLKIFEPSGKLNPDDVMGYEISYDNHPAQYKATFVKYVSDGDMTYIIAKGTQTFILKTIRHYTTLGVTRTLTRTSQGWAEKCVKTFEGENHKANAEAWVASRSGDLTNDFPSLSIRYPDGSEVYGEWGKDTIMRPRKSEIYEEGGWNYRWEPDQPDGYPDHELTVVKDDRDRMVAASAHGIDANNCGVMYSTISDKETTVYAPEHPNNGIVTTEKLSSTDWQFLFNGVHSTPEFGKRAEDWIKGEAYYQVGAVTYYFCAVVLYPETNSENFRWFFAKETANGDQTFFITDSISYLIEGAAEGLSGIIPGVKDEDGNPVYHNERARLVRERKWIKEA